MNAAGLTPKMQRCKDFIAVFSAMHGVSPSFQEIADNLGLKSKSPVHRIIHKLVDRGHATYTPNHSRTITILQDICPTCGHRDN